jgi:uncharacterized protein (TIGR03086 family)
MTVDPISRYQEAAAQADRVIAAITPDQLGNPTPCADWDVRVLLNHVVTGNLRFVSLVAGGPAPDPHQDHLGDDHLAAFRDSVVKISTAFTRHDVLNGRYQTPLGEGPGAQLVTMRFCELTVHAWDLARATGQPTYLDPDLATAALAVFEAALAGSRDGSPFAAARPVPADAGAADRLAAFTGREV